MPLYTFDAVNKDEEETQILINHVNEDMAMREASTLMHKGEVKDVDLTSCRLDEFSNDWMIN